jgi:hypothetical protein
MAKACKRESRAGRQPDARRARPSAFCSSMMTRASASFAPKCSDALAIKRKPPKMVQSPGKLLRPKASTCSSPTTICRGFRALTWSRRYVQHTWALPVILVSGNLPTRELDRNRWLQPVATLATPFTGHKLVGTVKKVLHETQSAREQIEPLPTFSQGKFGHRAHVVSDHGLLYPRSPTDFAETDHCNCSAGLYAAATAFSSQPSASST